MRSTDLANGDTLRFRTLHNGATTNVTYTQTPTINITQDVASGHSGGVPLVRRRHRDGGGGSGRAGHRSVRRCHHRDGIGQLRVRLQSTNAAPLPATDDWQLQWEKNASGTWVAVTAEALLTSYAESNQSGQDAIGALTAGSQGFGQSFQGDGQKLTKVRFKLNKVGSPTGTLTARLWTHNGTFGSGTVTGSAASFLTASTTTVVSSTLAASSTWVQFVFDGSYTLGNGTAYFIGLTTSTTSGDDANRVMADSDTSSPTYPGNVQIINGYGSVWTSYGGDMIFEVYTGGGSTTTHWPTTMSNQPPLVQRSTAPLATTPYRNRSPVTEAN